MNRLRNYMIAFFIVISFGFVIAEEAVIKGLMDRIFINFAALSKFMISEEKFKDPSNEKEIKERLKDLKDTISTTTAQHQVRNSLMKVSGSVLSEQFTDIERSFSSGHKSYARWMLNSSLSICMSCHLQVSKATQPFESLFQQNAFENAFDQAELRFVLRHWDKALALYDGLIKSFPSNKLSVEKLETTFKRKVAIFARIKRDPKQAIASLTEDQRNKKIPQFLLKNLESWIALFRLWEQEPKQLDPKKTSAAEILKFTERAMKHGLWEKMQDAENPKMVTYLRVSGLLYDYFHSHPKTNITPEILYWLAKCDRALNNNFFYSLAELYLKECVTKYPTTKIAKKCFIEYEDIITTGFSGSAGTEIPDDVKEELKKLSEMVN